jgi:transcriptional regulator with XRE-family HTH domain
MPRKTVKPPQGALAERLDYLFRTAADPAAGRPYTHRDVADAINRAAGEDIISHTYIYQLRTGAKDNPTRRHIAGLAAFFQVPPSYFFDGRDADAAGAQAEVAWRDDAVRDTALRTAGLSPHALRSVQALIESLRELEGLPGTQPPAVGAEHPRTSQP